MKILVTNDDGIFSAGIRRLAAEASKYGEVYVVAPSEQQSAKSHSVTFLKEVVVRETGMYGAAEAYEMEGTPADCVLWAAAWFRDKGIKFDYLFTGINMGANAGLAAYYSGTINAAREGALNGIRSIAFSVGGHDASEFDYICNLIPEVLKMSASLSTSTILSVNAPDIPVWEIKGVRIAEVAPFGYGERYVFNRESEGHYQLNQVQLDTGRSAGRQTRWFDASSIASDQLLGMAAEREAALRYDYDCIHNGYVAITPLSTHISDDVALNRLKGLFPQEEVLTLFVDIQENNISGLTGGERFAENIGKFARCLNRLSMPSVITEIYGWGETRPSVRLNTDRSETIVRRELSACGSYDFVRLMNGTPTSKVMICGAETHASVLRTALDLREKGYEVTVIEDCSASRGGHDHKMAIGTMRDAGCLVTTYKAAIAQVLYANNHPAAEAVRRIMEE